MGLFNLMGTALPKTIRTVSTVSTSESSMSFAGACCILNKSFETRQAVPPAVVYGQSML